MSPWHSFVFIASLTALAVSAVGFVFPKLVPERYTCWCLWGGLYFIWGLARNDAF